MKKISKRTYEKFVALNEAIERGLFCNSELVEANKDIARIFKTLTKKEKKLYEENAQGSLINFDKDTLPRCRKG